jgi:hypothetical protein
MRLVDLEPEWLNQNIFVFKCPHCLKVWLSCKNVAIDRTAQCELFAARFGGDWTVVPCKPEYAWKFESHFPFETISVTPSLNASAAGHWHGHITAGDIK